MSRVALVPAVAALLFVACSHRDVRGSFAPSQDGKTYLAVVDDNGGHCRPIKVDGRIWPHPVGQAGRIDPGHHTIECGGKIEFDIRTGVLFKFDYWVRKMTMSADGFAN
jgi:hypothetical protein